MNSNPEPIRWSRRAMLQASGMAGVGMLMPGLNLCRAAGDGHDGVLEYLENLSTAEGGYSYHPGGRPHLTSTFAVVGCYTTLRQSPPRKARLADFIRTHHPSRLKKLEQEHREFEFQQIQALRWLGEDASSFREQVSKWQRPTIYLKQYEQHGYPILAHEVTAFTCRALLGLPVDDLVADYVPYLESRRRSNGSFNNTPAREGADGHVANTWWGLCALQTLGRAEEQREQTVAWLQRCQRPGDGFTWHPAPEFAGVDDVMYTWAAVRSLQLLAAAPADPHSCIKYLLSLRNPDGGFGDRPGWLSNAMATYYALDALATLDALNAVTENRKRASRRRSALPRDLKVYSIQLEAHGQGSAAEAVDLAGSLRIHLWGAKNASPKWLDAAQSLADRQKVPVRFFAANEEYGTWVRVPGLGTYSHTSDIIAPAGSQFGESLARQGVVSWAEFRERRLAPLRAAAGRLIWQFGENEELVRLYLDDSLERGGYAAISTFHFGNPDFTNSEPFLRRYRGKIPFVALQDAHGEEPWWFGDMTTGFRTLFLGAKPDWENWLHALEKNWVAAVRHDAVSGNQTWTHAGSAEVLEFIRRHESTWRWWDNQAIQRPIVSLVALTPANEFEAARPETGVTLRVRCAWENTAQGEPKQPLTELVKLVFDGKERAMRLVTVPAQRRGGFKDHYHRLDLPDIAPGQHTATAFVREVKTGAVSKRTLNFQA